MIVEDPDFSGNAGRDVIVGGFFLGQTILFSWELAGEQQNRGENQKRPIFRYPTGEGCQINYSLFPKNPCNNNDIGIVAFCLTYKNHKVWKKAVRFYSAAKVSPASRAANNPCPSLGASPRLSSVVPCPLFATFPDRSP